MGGRPRYAEERLKAEVAGNAVRSPYWHGRPQRGLIVHSDRDVQYASRLHRELTEPSGMVMSMSWRANTWNIAPMKSFFKMLKVEKTSRWRYETRAQARSDVVDWIEGFIIGN